MKAFFIPIRLRSSLRLLLFRLALVVLTACSGGLTSTKTKISSPETLQTLAPFATITLMRTATSTSMLESPSSATSTPLSTATQPPAPVIDLPAPLYVLSVEESNEGRSLWVLKPGALAAEPVQTANEAVTCFDLSPVDGSLAFGTVSGRVYVQAEGETPRLIVDTSIDAPNPTVISGINWSPDGTQLAYTVGFHETGDVIQNSENQYWPSGVWIVDVMNGEPIWLASNSYESSEDIGNISRFHSPVWSPDGKALAVYEGKWEARWVAWFYPVQPVATIEKLHRAFYLDFSWSTDSEGLVIGGIPYDDTVGLAFATRAGGEEQQLLDGEKEQLDTQQVFALDTGIAFTAYKTGEDGSEAMFFGHFEGIAFRWQVMNTNPLCRINNTYPVLVHHTGEDFVTQLCGSTDLRLIEPAADTFKQIDLFPFMQPVEGRVIEIHWGK